MIDCISVENMRNSDAYTIETCTSSKELMYRAAYGVFRSVVWKGQIAILTGSGNNGGDGYALAYLLHIHGYACTVYAVSPKLSPDGSYYAQLAASAGVPIVPFTEETTLQQVTIIVDCLLGTGFHGEVREPYRSAIAAICQSNACVISVDINSGMNGDTGTAELAVHSDLTIAIGYIKTGLVSKEASAYIKKLICVDIGIVLLKEELKICGQDEPLLPGCIPCPPWLDMNTKKYF